MAEERARNRLAEAASPGARSWPAGPHVADAPFGGRRDLAAIRKALGQPGSVGRSRAVPAGAPRAAAAGRPAYVASGAPAPNLPGRPVYVAPRPVRAGAPGALGAAAPARPGGWRWGYLVGTLAVIVVLTASPAHEGSGTAVVGPPPVSSQPQVPSSGPILTKTAGTAGVVAPAIAGALRTPPMPRVAALVPPDAERPLQLAGEPAVGVMAQIEVAEPAEPGLPALRSGPLPVSKTPEPGRLEVAGLPVPGREPALPGVSASVVFPEPSRAAAADPSGGTPASPSAGPPPRRAVAPERSAAPSAVAAVGSRRVVIHYHRGVSPGFRQGLTASLRGQGFDRVEFRQVARSVDTTQTRYFHAGDRTLSDRTVAVLAELHRPARSRDFTFYQPPASPGTVEVWLSD